MNFPELVRTPACRSGVEQNPRMKETRPGFGRGVVVLARYKHHREPGVVGVCRECLLAEIEQAIAKEHPELERGEVFELVQEWLRLEDDLAL